MKISIEKVKENPTNPRTISNEKFEKLKKSIQDFPEMLQLRPIVVDSDCVVLGGNMRLKALKELGFKEVHIIKAESLSEDQKKEFLIKDNLGYGDWDFEELAANWDLQKLDDWGFDDLGLNEYIEANKATDDEFEMPEEVKTDIILGDIFDIGPHRLICGDSTQADTFSKLFGDKMADLVVTDPPYNVAYEGKTKEALTIQNDKQSDEGFYQFLYDFYSALGSYTKPGGGGTYGTQIPRVQISGWQ